MGEYIGISIKNHEYLWCKNSFGDLLTIFSKDDLHIEQAYNEDENEEYTVRYFATTVLKAKMALDCLGHTLTAAKADFEKSKAADLEYCDDDEEYKEIEECFTFNEWEQAVKKFALILSTDTYDCSNNKFQSLDEESKKKLSFTEQMVIGTSPFISEERYLNYEEVDLWNIFRVILDAFDADEVVELNYTNLFDGGWCDETPKDEEYNVPKTIILTEGKFDVEVISKCMDLLFPHMKKFYSFINFSEYKVQGSTNFLTHYLKAFIASGIQNRVIAIYDNDSAGKGEMITLSNISIPDNYRIMCLPDLDLASHYPTLGPSGKEYMNINGKACSIELFLGKDVLTDGNELIPIQWKGFKQTQTYQGEIMKKSVVQDNFREKIKQSLADNTDRVLWQDMIDLLNTIFEAFLDK